jgi:energy-coupling factor transporter ATP-binding protein EcfA2
MRAVTLKVNNILGFDEYELKFGNIVRIQGENGTGKSSLIGALLGVLEKGHDATLLRAGAEKGEAVILFEESDGSTTTLSKQVTPEGSKPKARNSKMGPISAPNYIKRVADLLALNPVAFLRLAKDKDRLEWLLKFCPLELSDADLRAAAGDFAVPTKDRNALEVIGQVRKVIYEHRHGVNQVAEDKVRTVRELTGTLPEDDGTDWAAELQQKRAEHESVVGKLSEISRTAQEFLAQEKDRIQGEYVAERQRLEDEAQAKIDAIRQQLAKDVETLGSRKDREIEEARQTAQVKSDEFSKPLDAQREALINEIGKLEEKVAAHHRAENTRQIINRTAAEAEAKKAEVKELTAALLRLDELKLKLVGQLPIPGGSVTDDGSILVDGVPLSRLNTARALGIALEVACRRAESLDCKLICLDDAEHLTRKNFQALEEACRALAEDGYQFVISRAVDPPEGWPEDKPYFEVQAE